MKPWIFDGHLPLLGQVSVPGYYFWLAVAFIAGAFVVTREARRAGVPTKVVLDLALIVLVPLAPGWAAVKRSFFNAEVFAKTFPGLLDAFLDLELIVVTEVLGRVLRFDVCIVILWITLG